MHSAVGSEADEAQLDLMSWTTDKEDFNEMFGTDPIRGVYVGLGSGRRLQGLKPTRFLADKIVFISRGIPVRRESENGREARRESCRHL